MTRIAMAIVCALWLAPLSFAQSALEQRNEVLFQQLEREHGLTAPQIAAIRDIFDRSGFVGQGNPAVARYAMSVEMCRAQAPRGGDGYANRAYERICAAMGKRICDAHEWEGACAGALGPPDYRFGIGSGSVSAAAKAHNSKYAPAKSWSYGPEYQRGICAAASQKSPGCTGGGWSQCGSNTYPTGAFPACHSTLGVYDLHGNAAEHMNLPLQPNQMASRGSTTLGVTEMKGSWFIFDRYRAHQDWCRWRTPFWHGSPVMAPKSHANYHLGFRCCKTVN